MTNPIVLPGEIALELDTGLFKIGDDGFTLFNDLPYANAGGGGGGATDFNSLTDATISSPQTGQVPRYNGTNWVNAVDNIKYLNGYASLAAAKAANPTADVHFKITTNLVVSGADDTPANFFVEFEGDGRITTTNSTDVFTINKRSRLKR